MLIIFFLVLHVVTSLAAMGYEVSIDKRVTLIGSYFYAKNDKSKI